MSGTQKFILKKTDNRSYDGLSWQPQLNPGFSPFKSKKILTCNPPTQHTFPDCLNNYSINF
jgi:hypothetical protein